MNSKQLYSKISEHLIRNGQSHATALIIVYSVERLSPAFIKQRLSKQNIDLSKFTIISQRRRHRDLIKKLIAQQQ
ncbi:hypothetical protein CTM85_20185 [Photobacterium phosphoreum]|nr:hypothetical protein CTM85_20185 [Photobacterium phosphoreum]